MEETRFAFDVMSRKPACVVTSLILEHVLSSHRAQPPVTVWHLQ
jgi:hypothetical protein